MELKLEDFKVDDRFQIVRQDYTYNCVVFNAVTTKLETYVEFYYTTQGHWNNVKNWYKSSVTYSEVKRNLSNGNWKSVRIVPNRQQINEIIQQLTI